MSKIKVFAALLLMAAALMVALSQGASAQVSGGTVEADKSWACSGVSFETVVWHPAAWPSPHLIESQRINYLGVCDSMYANAASGTVIAKLADKSRSEEIRCKYEVAGLSEWSARSDVYQTTARKVLESCGAVAGASLDVRLKRSLDRLSAQVN